MYRADGRGATRHQTAAKGANSRFMVKVDKCPDRAAVVENKGITSRQTASGATRARKRAQRGAAIRRGGEMYDGGDG